MEKIKVKRMRVKRNRKNKDKRRIKNWKEKWDKDSEKEEENKGKIEHRFLTAGYSCPLRSWVSNTGGMGQTMGEYPLDVCSLLLFFFLFSLYY